MQIKNKLRACVAQRQSTHTTQWAIRHNYANHTPEEEEEEKNADWEE